MEVIVNKIRDYRLSSNEYFGIAEIDLKNAIYNKPYRVKWNDGAEPPDSGSTIVLGGHAKRVEVFRQYEYDFYIENTCSAPATVQFLSNNCTPWMNANIVQNGCQGGATGSIELTSTSYTYFWAFNNSYSNVLTGLADGQYTVRAKKSSGLSDCYRYYTYTIFSNDPMDSYIQGQDASCFNGDDGSVYTMTTMGTPPYTYSWSNGMNTADVNGLLAGSYTVTITDLKDVVLRIQLQ